MDSPQRAQSEITGAPSLNHIELERFICAGAVDRQFRELVLRDPIRAAEGYRTERFHFTPEERALLASIHTNDFQIFVETVTHWIAYQRNGFAFPEPSAISVQIVPVGRRTTYKIFSALSAQT